MKTYVCSYNYAGYKWSFEIQAESMMDARSRMAFIQSNGQVDGELMATIPVPSFLERVLAWWHGKGNR